MGADAPGGGGGCFLASGREVPCDQLAKLGALMKSIYGKKVRGKEFLIDKQIHLSIEMIRASTVPR